MPAYTSLLVAIDLTENAPKVLAKAVELQKALNASLTVLHVFEYLPPIDLDYAGFNIPAWSESEDMLFEHAQTQTNGILKQCGLESAEHRVVPGVAKHEIVQTAEELKTGLIVIGAHSRHGLGRLLGSTANAVLHHAPCDVLAVHLE